MSLENLKTCNTVDDIVANDDAVIEIHSSKNIYELCSSVPWVGNKLGQKIPTASDSVPFDEAIRTGTPMTTAYFVATGSKTEWISTYNNIQTPVTGMFSLANNALARLWGGGTFNCTGKRIIENTTQEVVYEVYEDIIFGGLWNNPNSYAKSAQASDGSYSYVLAESVYLEKGKTYTLQYYASRTAAVYISLTGELMLMANNPGIFVPTNYASGVSWLERDAVGCAEGSSIGTAETTLKSYTAQKSGVASVLSGITQVGNTNITSYLYKGSTLIATGNAASAGNYNPTSVCNAQNISIAAGDVLTLKAKVASGSATAYMLPIIIVGQRSAYYPLID